MGVLYDPNNVIVGLAAGYFGPANEPAPDDTVPVFGDWSNGGSGNFVSAGATEEGWSLGGEASPQNHNIEEQPTPVRVTLDSRTLTISAQLAEDTLENLKYAFGGGTIVTTAGTAPAPTVKTFTLADDVEEFAIGLDMETVGDPQFGKATRRIYIPRAVGGASVEAAFRRSASKRLWAVQFTSVCKTSEILVKDIIPTV